MQTKTITINVSSYDYEYLQELIDSHQDQTGILSQIVSEFKGDEMLEEAYRIYQQYKQGN